MLFNSAIFLFVFLPITYGAYRWALCRRTPLLAKTALLLGSLVFYGAWNWRFVPWLLASITANHWVALTLATVSDGRRRRRLVCAAVTVNLLVLAYFKYAGWLSHGLQALGVGITAETQSALDAIILPLGISFFTFHVISFLVDCYRRTSAPGRWLDTAVYFVFFPHLVAGPILSHRDFAPQLAEPRVAPREWIARGLYLICVGLFKKLAIADSLARWVVAVYWPGAGVKPALFQSWMAVCGYTAQIYYDFSAYCEIALGLAMLFGYRFPINFFSPYRADTIQSFWSRWHITLGHFLRDYVYVPLGGSRNGFVWGLLLVLLTFTIGGLWHGAGMTFLVWGWLHAGYVIAYRLWQRQPARLPPWLARLLTLVAVMVAWVAFRAVDLPQCLSLWQGLIGVNGASVPGFLGAAEPSLSHGQPGQYQGLEAIPLAVVFAGMLWLRNPIERARQLNWQRHELVIMLGAWACAVFSLALPTAFLYFQF